MAKRNEGKVFPVSKKNVVKILDMRKATWTNKGKSYGPKSDKQIGWDLKLNEATVNSVSDATLKAILEEEARIEAELEARANAPRE